MTLPNCSVAAIDQPLPAAKTMAPQWPAVLRLHCLASCLVLGSLSAWANGPGGGPGKGHDPAASRTTAPASAMPPAQALRSDDELVICDSQAPQASQEADCVEFGAAIGTLGLAWRSQLPAKVRWVARRDAAELCQQPRSEFGERSTAALREGCIFVSAQSCTLVTLRPTAPAELGNAVRHCQP